MLHNKRYSEMKVIELIGSYNAIQAVIAADRNIEQREERLPARVHLNLIRAFKVISAEVETIQEQFKAKAEEIKAVEENMVASDDSDEKVLTEDAQKELTEYGRELEQSEISVAVPKINIDHIPQGHPLIDELFSLDWMIE